MAAEAKQLSIDSSDDIAAPLLAYNEYMLELDLVKSIYGGTQTMRLAGDKYLPREERETPHSYQNRLKRSVLTNYYKRTLEKLTGQAFEEDIEATDVPAEFEEIVDNIDMENTNLSMFMWEAFFTAMHKGVVHVMVDYPHVSGDTKEDHKKAGARPYWTIIDPECVIGWRFKDVEGRKILTQLRIKETIMVDDGKYGERKVERIRIYEPGSWEVYELDDAGKTWIKAVDEDGNPMSGTTSLDFIPLVTMMLGERMSEMTAKPCLQCLAELNCLHWQSSSDQRNILHYARMITYFGRMLDTDESGEVVFGANKLIHSTNPNGDLKVVEHTGAGIEAGRNDLKDLESAMAIFGLTLLLPKVSGVTATENSIEKGEGDSALLSWSKKMGSALCTLLDYTCKWLTIEASGTLKPYTDYTSNLSTVDNATLVEGYKCGLLPRELVINELKDRGVIRQEVDMVEIIRMFENDARSSAMMKVGLGQGQGEGTLFGQNPQQSGSQQSGITQ